MTTPVPDAPSTAPVAAVHDGASYTITGDGAWSWFTDPRARVRSGHLYAMAVDKAGTCRIHRTSLTHGSTTSCDLSVVALEANDHGNGAVNVLPDGRLLVTYGKHNDDRVRYRISTRAGDISAWGPELIWGQGGGPYSYPCIFTFAHAPGVHWLFARHGGGGRRNTSLAVCSCADIAAAEAANWSPVSEQLKNVPSTVCWRLAHDGGNRLHVLCTDMHPQQGVGQSSLYHFYFEVDAQGVLRRYRSDGQEITSAPPVLPADLTRIQDGSQVRCWMSDITLDSAGRPLALWMRYPHNDGSLIEYWHARWDGHAWHTHKIVDAGGCLYEREQFYHGGLCFDGNDPSRIYLSAPVQGHLQIQEWRTADHGAHWFHLRDITRGPTPGRRRIRPFSPAGHDDRLAVLWAEGVYTSYKAFDMAILGSP